MIQESLRHELGGDVTLITVAHRLQTIMDSDKIVRVIFVTSAFTCFDFVAYRWFWMREIWYVYEVEWCFGS